jgi:invasion protein IalB
MRHIGPKKPAFVWGHPASLDSPPGPWSEASFGRRHKQSRETEGAVSKRSRTVGMLAASALAALALGAPRAAAQGVVKNTFGEWQMRCETPPGAKNEQCALVQNVMAEDRPNLTLLVIALKTADGKARLLRMVAPLGILIPAGVGLKIDQNDIGRAGYVRCLTTGCIAEAVLDDTLLNQLKGGQSATFIVFQTPEEGVGIPVSLTGFGAGFDSLP